MFRFDHPLYLWLLLLIPILAIIYLAWARKRKKRMLKFGDLNLLRQLSPSYSKYRPFVKFLLMEFTLALMIIMLARPQMGTKSSTDKRKGIEAIIAMDISNSMLAEDVAPSRLEKSKMMEENLVNNFSEDRIGLIVFAGDAYVQLPITADYVSAKMFLNNIDPSLIGTQGTDIGEALDLAMHSFSQDTKTGKAIIVITDGEDHEGNAEKMAKKASNMGIRVFILGIGSSSGAPIPLGDGEYLKDSKGNTVMTRLNEFMCRQIASAGDGLYLHIDNNFAAEKRLNTELGKMQKGNLGGTVYSEFDDQFQAVAVLIILLLIIETMILEVKNPILGKRNIFHKDPKNKVVAVIILLIMTLPTFAQGDRQLIRDGNKFFHKRNYSQAETNYRKALSKNAHNGTALFNLGCALQAQNKDSQAIQQYNQAVKVEHNSLRRASSSYNLGTVYQKLKDYDKAIEAYKNALRDNPKHDNARYNLSFCMKQKHKQQQNQDKNQNQNKDKNKKRQKKSPPKDDKKKQQNNDEKLSKDNAEQLLNAAMQEEKATQKRLKKAMRQPTRRNIENNW